MTEQLGRCGLRRAAGPSAVVFSPAPLLTVTIEDGGARPELHLHAGGQGSWVAQLIAELGAAVCLVGPVGGEAGRVLRGALERRAVRVRAIESSGSNGWYVHDRRSGERVPIASCDPACLSRHELDELYGAAVVEGLDADVCVLTGAGGTSIVPPELYERLAADLRANGRPVVADLSGEVQAAVVRGGVSILKVSEEELARDAKIERTDTDSVAAAATALRRDGAETVVVTRAERGVLVSTAEEALLLAAPSFRVVEARGAGDSFTAAMASGIARGLTLVDAVRLGTAAGALNVTRRGLGTGAREEIERLASKIGVERLQHRPEVQTT